MNNRKSWDWFVFLAETPEANASGSSESHSAKHWQYQFIDRQTVEFLKAKAYGSQGNKPRNEYIKRLGGRKRTGKRFCVPPEFSNLPSSEWVALEVEFTLKTPWYSRDDRIFYVMDNPLRKDRVFGVPFMSASSWKGLLRWACRMQAGLKEHFACGRGPEEWKDPEWIVHLFGNEKGGEHQFTQGALVFYPTWFPYIDFEVINPHKRKTRAGTQPIYYEVVPPNKKAKFSLLYAPWPGMGLATDNKTDKKEAISNLLKAIEALLTTYGFSAKRTVGWGTAGDLKWRAVCHRNKKIPPGENGCAELSEFSRALLQEIENQDNNGGSS